MTDRSGPTAWAVLPLRNEASLLRERKRQVEDYGYHPRELSALSDAASAADRMAAAVQAGDRRALRQNLAEFDKFIDFAGSASPYGWKPGRTPVDDLAAEWKAEEEEAEPDDDVIRRGPGTHPVRAYTREEGERVRSHLARNPRRTRRRWTSSPRGGP